MSSSAREEYKCCDIQVMKDKRYTVSLFYVAVEAATGGVLDLTS